MRYFLFRIFGFLAMFVLFAGLCAAAEMSLDFNSENWFFRRGAEFPGASGRLSFLEPDLMRLEGNFTGGGDYVQASLTTNMKFPEAKAVRFEVRTSASRVSFRFLDSSGQYHQASLPLSGDASKFQTVTFALEATGLAWSGANDKKFHSPMIHFGVIIRKVFLKEPEGSGDFRNFTLLGVSAEAEMSAGYRLPQPEKNFISPGSQEPVRIQLTSGPKAITENQLRYRYSDYTGREVSTGVALFDDASRLLTLPAPQTVGYYDLELPGLDINTAVAVNREFQGESDPFFGMDTSLSRKNHIDGESIRSLLKILRRNGISWGRDRFTWGDVHPERDRIDFAGRNGRYELFRSIAKEENIDILDVFHDTPNWNRYPSVNKSQYCNNLYPSNLLDAATSWSAICRHWPQIKALEVWNEPDIFFGGYYPPEFFIAFTKAVSTRFALDGVSATVVGGVIANPRTETDYYKTLIEGGLLHDSDVFSYHSYRNVEFHEKEVAALRELERKYAPSRAGIPHWVTESGKAWPRGTARALVDDDRHSTSEIVGKAIEFRALGIAKHFSFCYAYYDENVSNFGMMDEHFAPMRSMAAYGNCAMLLAHKSYIGDLMIPDATRSRVFSDGKSSIACIYVPLTPKTPMKPLALPKGLRAEKITGLDGRELAMKDGEIPLDDGIAYLHIKGRPGSKFLKADTVAMGLYKQAKAYRAKPRAARPVVIQPDSDLGNAPHGDRATRLIPGEPFEVKLLWNNLSDQAKTVKPALTLPQGVRAEGFTDKLAEIPANSRMELRFRLIADGSFADASVTVSDKRGNATPMVMPISFLPRRTTEIGKQVELTDWNPGQSGKPKADIKAHFTTSRTADGLQIRIEVEDETHFCDYSAGNAWRGDSVQIGLWGGGDESYELCVAKSQEGTQVYHHRPRGKIGITDKMKFDFSREGTKSIYTLEFPYKEFDAKADVASIGLTVIVNSNNGKGRGYLYWGQGIDSVKNPQLFNRLILNK